MNKKVDCVFYNGKIFTSNPEQLYASAMIVKEGRITWIGEEKDLKTSIGVEKVDLNGRRVLPGFIDAHMHPLFLADTINQIACTPPVVNSIEDILLEIRKKRKLQKTNEWIIGWGYDEGKLLEGRTPTRWDLDKGTLDVPVILTRTCYHIYVVNSIVLKLAGIDKNTPDPIGGQIDRDSNGEPTGILRETAKELVNMIMPSQSIEDSTNLLVGLSKKLLAHGITAVSEAGARTEPIDFFEIYEKAYENGFRQRAVLYYEWKSLKEKNDFEKYKTFNERHIHIGGIKLIGDGSVSGKTAWINPAYLEDSENYGVPIASKEELLDAADFAQRNKLQVVVHAMGEQAIDLVVDTFYNKKGWLEAYPSIRIEHAAMPTNKAIDRAFEAGIAFTSQPIFMYAEIESYLKNLGQDRTKKTYPFKDILNAGVKMAFSSDAPATAWADPADPFVAIKSAVTRFAYDGTDTGQSQRIDIETSIMLYTKEAQQIIGIPYIGQLAIGYYADFMVLDKDILEITPEKIDEICVDETYMSAELVYRNK